MKHTLIIGATSGIAEDVCRLLAARGERLYLLARAPDRLAALAADLRVRGAESVQFAVFEATDFARHAELIAAADTAMQGIDVAFIAHGTLSDQAQCQRDVSLLRRELDINAVSTLSLLTHLANSFEQKKSGTIAVISSVAGDRGRQSNYVYGAAKAAVSTFLQGLRNRLYFSGVAVVTIKPGFVDTPMTGHLPKGALWASSGSVAAGIVRALDRRGEVVYLPGFWRVIMWIVRMVPEGLFKRLKL